MTGLCNLPLDLILWAALAFIVVSLIIGAISAVKSLGTTSQPSLLTAADGQPIAPILQALKDLIEALGKAPAWFALFLAGLFLFWLASEVYVDACKPATPVTKVTVTTDTKTIITKTAPSAVPVAPARRPATPAR